MTGGSVFSGCLGLDLGFQRAGVTIKYRVEKDTQCRKLIQKKHPEELLFHDIRNFLTDQYPSVDVIFGGDPCPKHSRARTIWGSKHPDLSGYYLAVVGRYGPRWVVRENVLAPTVNHFAAALEALGYRTIIVRMDAAKITGQSRQRDFIIGTNRLSRTSLRDLFSDCSDGSGPNTAVIKTQALVPTFSARRDRYDSSDCYIYVEGRGLRIPSAEERERFTGIPEGWTAGFSESTRARMLGNSALPVWGEFIGRKIKAVA
jgi:site-specific DNA-cytosine methylase